MNPWGVYVHVPWCRVRCPYCAFDILPRERPDETAWTTGVLRDLERWRPQFEGVPSTLYLGGGTPSRLTPATLGAVVEAVGAPDVTIEANPEDLTDAWLAGVLAHGVTRVSLGVQSTHPQFSRLLGRAHVPPEQAVQRLKNAALQSWSVDLIFGLPGQSLADLEADLDAMLAWNPPHVSLYGLTIEPGTAFATLAERGSLTELDADLWRSMYDHLVARLQDAGLERYEVSNFAQPGHRSRHNALYWTQAPYLAAGPSAHGFAPDGRRWSNPSFRAWADGVPPDIERPDAEQRATDAIVAGLRGVEGISPEALGSYEVDPRVLHQLRKADLLSPTTRHLQLSANGFPVADAVVRALVDALRPRTG